MIFDYLSEYFRTLVNTMDFPVEAVNNACGLVTMLLAYIPLHLIIKPLVGEKNATLAVVAYLVIIFVTATRFLVGGN